MKIYKINPKNPEKEILNEAIEVLANGGIVLYPTDTVYGLGANIFNKKAVEKVYKIKNRSFENPLSVMVQNPENIHIIANLDKKNKTYINNSLPGPFTFILNKKSVVPDYITNKKDTVGVRVPDCEIARNLAELFPITTTSANLSKEKTLSTPEEILQQLNCKIDLVLDIGKLDSENPSKIIDLTNSVPKFLKRN